MFRSAVRSIARKACTIFGAACLSTFLAAGVAQGQGLFQSPSPTLPAGTTPQGVAAADFARSGFQSLVVTDSKSKNIKVYLGTGPGTFANAVTYAACTTGANNTGPTAVATQDINGDGYPDIVVACPSAGNVTVFTNNGAGAPGAFTEAGSVNITNPSAIVLGDFNNSGKVSAAVASSSGGITILLNVGGTEVTKTAAAAGTLSGIVTGDFNHDGKLDLAVTNAGSNTNNVRVLFGDGTGNFTSNATYTVGHTPSGIAVADFNHDGNLDLAVSNPSTSNSVNILLGGATGAFTVQTAVAAGTNPIAIATADVDNDGNPDVIAFDSLSTTTGAIAVLLGNGNGTLQAAQISTQAFLPGTQAAVADLNRDGKPDLAVTQQNAGDVSVFFNNTLPTQYPDGRSYSSAAALTNGQGNMADSVAVGDFNKDGKLDIAVSYFEDKAVRVLINNGNGFNTAAVYTVGNEPYSVASADLNADSYPDLVTANTADGTISVLLNNRNGTFAAATTYTVGTQPFQVAIGDVNGDNIPDLAVSNYGSNTVTVLFGHAGGTFTVASTLTLGTGCGTYGVAIGDFSHNGFPDVAATCSLTSQLYVFPNNGNGTFSATPFIGTTDTAPATLVVGDFNRDGKLDVVTGNTTANDISFFAGNGNGTFAGAVTGPSLNFPATIAAGDVNGDGILDIVGVAPNFNSVEVTLGVGNGTFGTIQQRAAGIFTATKQPWGVALGDFNNDGLLDIVTADTFNQVNIADPLHQARYVAQFPAIPAGNPSIDVLTNYSGTDIGVASSPASPISPTNTGVTVTANVQPAIGGATPSGSVILEDATGAPVGGGPVPLTAGIASYSAGHLGSGSYLFTALYSGDANYQPATVSGPNSAITVSGTPVTLALSTSSVSFGSTFTATVTVIGNATTGSFPQGTATIFALSGTTAVALGTTATLQQVAGGHTSTRSITITANAPNLNPGTYQLYAVFNPSNGTYPQGSSSDEPLTVVAILPTSTTISCTGGFLTINCTTTTTVTATGVPVSVGNTVNYSGAGNATEVTNALGQTSHSFAQVFGDFTITASFPAQNGYGASTNNTGIICFIICGLDRTNTTTLNSFSGLGSFSTPAIETNARRNTPFSFF